MSQLNYKSVYQWLSHMQTNNSDCYIKLCQILIVWNKSQQTQVCYNKLKHLISCNKNEINTINKFLDDQIKIKKIHQNSLEDLHSYDSKNCSISLQKKKNAYSTITNSTQLQNKFTSKHVSQNSILPSQTFVFKQQIRIFPSKFNFFIKILHLYMECIITRSQFQNLMPKDLFCQQKFQMLMQIIEETQNSRRRASMFFHPLNDVDFAKSQRATHSYVSMPLSYPIKCSGKNNNSFISFLNDKWVSVPVGSQHSRFSIMHKNPYQQSIFKSQDQKYQIDLHLYRLAKIIKLLQNITKKENISKQLMEQQIDKVIKIGELQLIYKNSQITQKQQLQQLFKSHPQQSSQIILQRINLVYKQLRQTKELNMVKIWNDIAQKNFYKSLDRISFDFKKNDRFFSKNIVFEKQLEMKLKNTQDQDSNSYFKVNKNYGIQILNTFQNLSKNQKCQHDRVPCILKSTYQRQQLPLFVLMFQNKQINEFIYQLLDYYNEYFSISSNNEKQKIRFFIKSIFGNFFNWGQSLEIVNNNQMLFGLIEEDVKLWMLPFPTSQDKILYGPHTLYLFIRNLYILYQRIFHSQQLLQNVQFFILFKQTILNSLSSKDINSFQQSTKQIFGSKSYMFNNLHKHIESVMKSISECMNDELCKKGFQLYWENIRQDLCFFQINKFYQQSKSNNNLFRLLFTKDQILFINCFKPMYSGYEIKKNFGRQIGKKMQNYLRIKQNYRRITTNKKENQILINNGLQLQSSIISLRLKGVKQTEDYLQRKNKQGTDIKLQLQKTSNFLLFLHN